MLLITQIDIRILTNSLENADGVLGLRLAIPTTLNINSDTEEIEIVESCRIVVCLPLHVRLTPTLVTQKFTARQIS